MSTSSPHEEEESSWEMEFPIPTPAPASWCTEGAKWPKRRHISHRALLHISARLTEAKSSLHVAPLTPHRCGISNDKTKRGWHTQRHSSALKLWTSLLHLLHYHIQKTNQQSHGATFTRCLCSENTQSKSHKSDCRVSFLQLWHLWGKRKKKFVWWF